MLKKTTWYIMEVEGRGENDNLQVGDLKTLTF